MAELLAPDELNLLTLNCWGLKIISAQRVPRLREIGRQLALEHPRPDIVCLQECWVTADYEAIRHETRHVLPHGKFYHAGAFGAGLAILSRFPLEESSMTPYALCGRPTAVHRGDWFVGKGIAGARIRIGSAKGDVVQVFNTHTHAPYESQNSNPYLVHRLSQSWQLSSLIRSACGQGNLVLALGDFNMCPLSRQHQIITSRTSLRDVWRLLHPSSSLGPARLSPEKPVPTAEDNLVENGATSDSVYNTWRWTKTMRNRLKKGDTCPVDPATPDPRGKRLDYIFASSAYDAASRTGWAVKSASVAMTQRHPSLHCSLSDHFALRATLVRHTLSSEPSPLDAHLHEEPASLPLALYEEVVELVQNQQLEAKREAHWRKRHFPVALFAWVACLVALWWVPHRGISFALMLISGLNLVAGTVNGLIGLLSGGAERRALKEFAWELQVSIDSAKRKSHGQHTDDQSMLDSV